MKHIFLNRYCYIIGAIIFLCACKKSLPEDKSVLAREFDFNVLDSAIGLTFKFIDTSKNASGYIWEFGDGSSSKEVTPIHKYKDLGKDTSYTVRRTAISQNGYKDIIEQTIYVGTVTPSINVNSSSSGNAESKYFINFSSNAYHCKKIQWYIDNVENTTLENQTSTNNFSMGEGEAAAKPYTLKAKITGYTGIERETSFTITVPKIGKLKILEIQVITLPDSWGPTPDIHLTTAKKGNTYLDYEVIKDCDVAAGQGIWKQFEIDKLAFNTNDAIPDGLYIKINRYTKRTETGWGGSDNVTEFDGLFKGWPSTDPNLHFLKEAWTEDLVHATGLKLKIKYRCE